MQRCPNCRKPLKPSRTTYPVSVGSKVVKVVIPAWRCSSCGEVLTDGKDMERAELAVAERVLQSGYSNGESLRFLRHVLGMRSNELAEFLDTTPETITRWERGTRKVDRMVWIILMFLVVGRMNRDETKAAIQAIAKPRPLPARIKLAS